MIKMAFCDDEEEQRAAVGDLLRAYAAARPGLAVKLSVFSSGRDLLAAAEACGGFDLYVLDIVMPELAASTWACVCGSSTPTGPSST